MSKKDKLIQDMLDSIKYLENELSKYTDDFYSDYALYDEQYENICDEENI